MPELPEVEIVCRSLQPHLVGRTIARVKVLEPRLRTRVDEKALARLAGRSVTKIVRKGKYILILLDRDAVWVFHLGMSGKLICADPGTVRKKHDHIVVYLDGGGELRYHDPRRFGLSLTTTREKLHELPQFRQLGLDPFDPALTGEYLFRFTRSSARRIRDLLLDQRIIAGLGNIYTNEILFLSGIKPTTRAHRLTRRQVQTMATTIPELLQRAIRWCGTSFSDYRDANDRQGEFQNHLQVYDRHGEPCRVCLGHIRRIAIGNRSGFYCASCQR
jgi:formamidopyrimidine-DNA glycosylase